MAWVGTVETIAAANSLLGNFSKVPFMWMVGNVRKFRKWRAKIQSGERLAECVRICASDVGESTIVNGDGPCVSVSAPGVSVVFVRAVRKPFNAPAAFKQLAARSVNAFLAVGEYGCALAF